ncbi:MAG TPA: T9SS type A sorting domain-containing protein, partial [Fibrella sp.]
ITINAPLASGVSSPDLPVWPNPARSGQVVYLNVPEASPNEAVNIILFDRAGKPVFEQVQRKQSGPLLVALPSLPAGLYIVEMTPSAATRISRRLLIE